MSQIFHDFSEKDEEIVGKMGSLDDLDGQMGNILEKSWYPGSIVPS
jgi:hypothetical protein